MEESGNILFITGADESIGAGHLYRCIEYAKQLRELGFKTYLKGPVNLKWMVPLALSVFEYDFESSDIKEYDVAIVDLYDSDLIANLLSKTTSRTTVQIADSNSPIIFPNRILWLDPNPPSNKSFEIIGSGLKYMPIKKYVTEVGFTAEARNVLINSGGTSQPNVLNFAREMAQAFQFRSVSFHLFYNGALETRGPKNLTIYPIGPYLHEVASGCDTVITSAGTSVWDFIANKKIVGVYSLVENQLSNLDFLHVHDLSLRLGQTFNDMRANIKDIRNLMFNTHTRKSLYEKCNSLVDFHGASRFAELISGLCVES